MLTLYPVKARSDLNNVLVPERAAPVVESVVHVTPERGVVEPMVNPVEGILTVALKPLLITTVGFTVMDGFLFEQSFGGQFGAHANVRKPPSAGVVDSVELGPHLFRFYLELTTNRRGFLLLLMLCYKHLSNHRT